MGRRSETRRGNAEGGGLGEPEAAPVGGLKVLDPFEEQSLRSADHSYPNTSVLTQPKPEAHRYD